MQADMAERFAACVIRHDRMPGSPSRTTSASRLLMAAVAAAEQRASPRRIDLVAPAAVEVAVVGPRLVNGSGQAEPFG
jgi:hypothetical protein